MTKLYAVYLLLMLAGIAGCDDPHDNAPIQPASFRIDKDKLTGNVGGGGGFASTHWERYTDERTGQTIVCFSPNNNMGGTSLNVACVTEENK